MPRTTLAALAAATLLTTGLTASGPASAAPTPPTRHYDLPAGFQPEGITTDAEGRFAYLGSRVDGDLVRVTLRTGRVKAFSQGPGTPSVGLKVDDRDRIFVAGGTAGDVRVVDATTGEVRKSYQLVSGTAFLNDVVLTEDAAYVTDSANAQLFELPFGKDGRLPKRSEVRRIPLTGDWQQLSTPAANGITETPDGRSLLVVNTSDGRLYRVNPTSGRARAVDLGAATLTNGDGLLLEGRTLYAVQNRLNQVAVLKVATDGLSARLTRTITDPDLDVPTTVARGGDRLYLPNARFGTAATPATPYWVTGIPEKAPKQDRKRDKKQDGKRG